MENLPFYITTVFVLTTLLTVFLLYKASRSMPLIWVVLAWLVVQSAISLTGFYTVTTGTPPRFALLLMPPLVFIIIFTLMPKGRTLTAAIDVKTLTLLHVVRIPVELTLYWLFLHKAVPQIMTFEGRNFDILCGLTAPLVYYFGYVKNVLNKAVLIIWNLACLLLLANIVVLAFLSAPFTVQKFGFGQPNIALFYFPFIWLPCCVVPIVFLAHLVSLRRLLGHSKVSS